MTTVIGRLRAARQARGLSIEKLAHGMGISPAALGSWERSESGRCGRHPRLAQVEEWAAALDMRVSLVPETEPVDYFALADVIAALTVLAKHAPTLADMAEGVRLQDMLRSAPTAVTAEAPRSNLDGPTLRDIGFYAERVTCAGGAR